MATQDPFRYPRQGSGKHADLAHLPKVEWCPIGALRPNPRNARTHPRATIAVGGEGAEGGRIAGGSESGHA
jgi:hypothetical protein